MSASVLFSQINPPSAAYSMCCTTGAGSGSACGRRRPSPPLIMTPCDGDPLARLPSRCSRPMDQLQACARLRVLVCVTLAVKSGTRRSHSISAGRADGRSDSWAWTDPGPNPLPAPSSIHRAPLPPSCPSTRQMPCRDGMGGRKRGHHDAR